jgi:hypothetical protein
MQFGLPIFTLFLVLLSMLLPTFIAAILDEVAVIALLQFDIIDRCNATRSTAFTLHFLIASAQEFSFPFQSLIS